MAGGFTSPAGWIGYSASPASGGYITLPWWQAGGGVGTDPEVPPRGGEARDRRIRRQKLQEQFEREREELFNRIFGPERSVEARVKEQPDGLPPVVESIRPSVDQIKREVAQQVQRFIDRHEAKQEIQQLRQQLVAAVHKELKLREEEEELLVFMLLHGGD